MVEPTISVNDGPDVPLTRPPDEVLRLIMACGFDRVDIDGTPNAVAITKSICAIILRERAQ